MRTMSAFKLVLRAALVVAAAVAMGGASAAPLQDRDAALVLSNDDLWATNEPGLQLELEYFWTGGRACGNNF